MAREPRKLNQEALVNLLQEEGLDFRDSANSYLLECPICHKDKWAIRKKDGCSKCYHCGPEFQGTCDYTLSQVLKKTKQELSKILYGFVINTAKVEELGESKFVDHWGEMEREDVEIIEVRAWPSEMLPSPDHRPLDSALGAPGLAYLQRRGVSLELAKEYGVTYNTAEERVVFPLVVEGVLRGWQGRLVRSGKYTDRNGNAKELPKILTEGEVGGKILGFQDRLKGSKHGIIAEGPLDAIKLHLCGGNTFTMGKSVTAEQLDIYVNYFGLRKIYIGLDDDAAEDVERIVRELSWRNDMELFRLLPPPGRGDLGDGTLEENLEQFRVAQPIFLGQKFSYLQTERYR